MPSVRSFFTNVSVTMPLHRKLRLVFRNNLIKIYGGDRDAAAEPIRSGTAVGARLKGYTAQAAALFREAKSRARPK